MRTWKAGYTVEAALLCPLLCLIICMMLLVTLSLYEKVWTLGKECAELVNNRGNSADIIRMERMAYEWLEE